MNPDNPNFRQPINHYLIAALGHYLSDWPKERPDDEIMMILKCEVRNENGNGDSILQVCEAYEDWPEDMVFEHILDMYKSLKENFIPKPRVVNTPYNHGEVWEE